MVPELSSMNESFQWAQVTTQSGRYAGTQQASPTQPGMHICRLGVFRGGVEHCTHHNLCDRCRAALILFALVLWIRSDLELLPGSGSGIICCGSGSS